MTNVVPPYKTLCPGKLYMFFNPHLKEIGVSRYIWPDEKLSTAMRDEGLNHKDAFIFLGVVKRVYEVGSPSGKRDWVSTVKILTKNGIVGYTRIGDTEIREEDNHRGLG